MDNGEVVRGKEVHERIKDWWICEFLDAKDDDFVWIREDGKSIKISRVNVEECD